jgi:IS5 family transposase
MLFFDVISRCLEKCCRVMYGGSIINVTILSAPSSTKNAAGERDPEMHQTKKGNEWRFRMKFHTEVSAANVHDIVMEENPFRKDERSFMSTPDISE